MFGRRTKQLQDSASKHRTLSSYKLLGITYKLLGITYKLLGITYKLLGITYKLLGITIDSLLTFDQHVENLCKKVAQRIGVLRNIRRFLPLEQRKLYYNTMIKPILLYGSKVWVSCSKENIMKVFKLQKRAARVIMEADTRSNSVRLSKSLGSFFGEAWINRLTLIQKRLYGDCSVYMSQMLLRNADINERVTRHGLKNLVCPRFKLESEGGRSFIISSTRFWNSLPNGLKTLQGLMTFKTAIFQQFNDKYKDIDHFSIDF